VLFSILRVKIYIRAEAGAARKGSLGDLHWRALVVCSIRYPQSD
jgi:hypothetical protein